ncbi:MAG: DinB family protein [Anaerolineae bacterium]|jgi:uncharacterized damage-inducible protein DinB
MTVAKIIQFWSQIRADLIDTIDKFTGEDLSYTPVENGYSVGEIILHIAHEEYGEIQYGLTREIAEFPPQFSKDEYQTLQSIQALLAGIHKQTIEYLETLDDTDLDQEFEAQWGETRPLIEFIAHVIEHEIHHRGELSLILGLLGREGLDA